MTSAGPHLGPHPGPPHGREPHAPADTVLTPLGDVLTGRAEGRVADSDSTVFDSSGIGVQDLYPGLALLEKMDISL